MYYTAFSDKELVTAISIRKRVGAEALYDCYSRLVFKTIKLHVQDNDPAIDLLEQVLADIWINIGEFDPKVGTQKLWIAGRLRMAAKTFISNLSSSVTIGPVF